MTKVYDFSVTDIREHNFAFAEMTEGEIAAKKSLLEEHQKSKAAAQPPVSSVATTPVTESKEPGDVPKPAQKPVFRPKIKPPGPPPSTT
jgi:hypothetical protein